MLRKSKIEVREVERDVCHEVENYENGDYSEKCDGVI